MTRADIFEAFRAENPEIPTRVVSDAVLADWALVGDKIVCALTRCIVGDTTFNSVTSTTVYDAKYNLTSLISKFQDIDDFPGGGVSFDNVPLKKTSVGELDAESLSWRKRTAGTPSGYYRRANLLYFDRPVKTADKVIRVYYVLVSDDFDDDNKLPYNSLTYLEPYHNGINKYLQWQAKIKVGEPQNALKAEQDFYGFITMMKKNIGGGKFSPIRFEPKTGYNQ